MSFREGVRPDNRLVRLNVHPSVVADHPAGLDDLSCVDVAVQVIERLARLERHCHFFEAGVARALADAVDGHLRLARARAQPGERVGRGQPEIVRRLYRLPA